MEVEGLRKGAHGGMQEALNSVLGNKKKGGGDLGCHLLIFCIMKQDLFF